MLKRLLTIMLAAAVFVSVGTPFTLALDEGEQAGSEEVFTVEVKDVTSESAKLIWFVADDKDYSYEDATFSIYNGDEAIASDLVLLDEDSEEEDGYALEFDEEKNADVFTYDLNGLTEDTEYNIQVRDDDPEKNSSGSAIFTTLQEEIIPEEPENIELEEDVNEIAAPKETPEETPEETPVEAPEKASEGVMRTMSLPAVEAPANVTAFKAKQTSNNNVALSWEAVKGANGYVIEWSGNGKSGTLNIDSGTTTKYTHKIKVVDVKRYTYKIKAYKLDGSKKVKSKSAKTAYIPAISLKATKVTAGTVTLKWTVSKPY